MMPFDALRIDRGVGIFFAENSTSCPVRGDCVKRIGELLHPSVNPRHHERAPVDHNGQPSADIQVTGAFGTSGINTITGVLPFPVDSFGATKYATVMSIFF